MHKFCEISFASIISDMSSGFWQEKLLKFHCICFYYWFSNFIADSIYKIQILSKTIKKNILFGINSFFPCFFLFTIKMT